MKPLVDDLHEEFIEIALGSSDAKNIPFDDYISKRIELIKLSKANKAEGEKTKGKIEKEIDDISKKLRTSFDSVFTEAGEQWKKKYGKEKGFEWKIGGKVVNGAAVTKSQDVLKRYQLYAQYFCMIEMGYEIDKLFLHSLEDNKRYEIPVPDESEKAKFERVLSDMRAFDMSAVREHSCARCTESIYGALAW